MIGHQILLSLAKEDFKINAHFKNKKKNQDLLKAKNITFHFLEITSLNIQEFLKSINPDIIINAAGVTIRRLKVTSVDKVIFTNSLLPHILNDWSEKYNCRLIHFSTDCVFSGNKGNYKDNDLTDALDLYGKTKSLGEINSKNTLTLRSSMIGFELHNRSELLEWVISNKKKSINGFSNVIYSGITTLLMSRIVVNIINDFPKLNGILNVSSAPISKFSLLRKINDIFDLNIKINPVKVKSSDKSLESRSFYEKTGIKINTWDTMLKELKENWILNKHIYED